MKRQIQRRTVRAVAVAVIVSVVVAGAVLPSLAQEDPLPIAVELLTGRAEFTDDVAAQFKVKLGDGATNTLNLKDPSLTAVARITVQPGARFPWHTHPGPVIVNVAQGELVYVNANDCVHRAYPTETVFVDPGRGNVHTAYNRTDGVTVVFATFFEVPATGPLTITAGVEEPADCQVEVGAHGSH
ncbi:MAG: cupin domain-containing protein [Nitriliruptorales bacterium]|nr:cupin domain-containing protein [Nitriliruptorales bacterium]